MGMKKKQMQTCGEVTEQAPSDTSTLDNSAADTSTQGAHLSDTPAQDDALPDISALTITQPATNPKTKERFDVVKAWKAYFREGELSDWARFCIDLGLEGDFSSKRKCKKAMKNIWINIHDFLRAEDKAAVPRHASEAELSAYTLLSKKTFPRKRVEKDSPLKLLLARILYPGRWQGGRKGGKG